MKIVLTSLSDKRTQADIFAAGFFQKERLHPQLAALEPSFTKLAKQALEKKRFEGTFAQIFPSYHSENQEAPEVILLGLGQKKNYRRLCCRKAAAQIVQLAKSRKAKRIRVLIESFSGGGVSLNDAVGILSEIPSLALYEFDKYKSKKKDEDGKYTKPEILEILLAQTKAPAAFAVRIENAQAIAEGIQVARDLINEPANVMNPQKLAEEAEALAKRKKIHCEILDQAELKRLKMGGILAVNQGSRTPAALIILEYGSRFKNNGTVCLVGKGVTFDTGGISIKPAKDMEKMKYDMSGAAAVIATLGVVADLKLSLHVVGIAPAVENMVAENPQRPGDIIRMYNGKSVEVLNTDAEGRLILGDALAYSAKYKPNAIIDLATLTGMCAYTFGDKAVGLMGNDGRLLAKVKKAGEETGERCWELPLWDEYGDQIKGHHSDLYNIGGPYGGTITAAMFLKEFVPEKTPWAHLDIAGTAWADSSRYDCAKGATGAGVRLLVELLSRWKK